MSKKVTFILLILTVFCVLSAETVHFNQNDGYKIDVISSDRQSTVLELELNSFNIKDVEINGETYSKITLDDATQLMEAGYPDLPKIRKSIIIPEDGSMSFTVLEQEFETISLNAAPSKGRISRMLNPADVPYTFSGFYNSEETYPSRTFSLGEPYIMRETRGQVVSFQPFRYNAGTKELSICRKLKVRIYSDGLSGANTLDSEYGKATKDFFAIYKHHFINFDEFFSSRYTFVPEKGRILIIYYDDYEEAITPLYEWKLQMGIETIMTPISTVGNTQANIHELITDYYNQEASLAYVILVGDAEHVTPYMEGGTAKDPLYSLMTNDQYPDLFISRFSADNELHVETQVAKTIYYERDITSEADWLNKACGIASSEGTGDDGQTDIQHMNAIRDSLLDYTYIEVDQIHEGAGGSTAGIAAAVNEGRSLINYVGHGWIDEWSSVDFNNNDVENLTNYFKLPFAMSVACNTGEFDTNSGECFAEHWLRAGTPEQPTGAVGFYGSSISQDWSPPMEGQDEFNNLLTGKSGTGPITHTFGALCFNGSSSMIDKYGNQGDIFPTWVIFGDASVMIRTDIAQELNPVHLPILPIGASSFQVSVPGIDGALAAIAKDGVLYGSDYTDEGGNTLINFDGLITEAGTYTLTITGYNLETYVVDLQGASLCNAEFSIDELPINQETTFTITITDDDDNPIEGVICQADGIGNTWDTTPVASDANGIATITMTYPFGDTVVVFGKREEDNYDLFKEKLPVTGGADFTAPDFAVETPLNLEDAFIQGVDGTINIDVTEADYTIYAYLNNQALFEGSENTPLIVNPGEVGTVKAILTKTGYNFYEEEFEVSTATGKVSGTVSDPDSGEGIENLEIMFFERNADVAEQECLFSVITDDEGCYQMSSEYPVAYYDLYIETFGYEIFYEEDFVIGIGPDNVKDISLSVASPSYVSGILSNDSDEPLKGTVKVYRQDTGELYTQTLSDDNGNYLVEVPDFAYRFKVKAQGYHTYKEDLFISGHTDKDFTLAASSGVLIISSEEDPFYEGAQIISNELTALGVTNTIEPYIVLPSMDFYQYESIILACGNKSGGDMDILLAEQQIMDYVTHDHTIWVEGGRVGFYYSLFSDEFLAQILHEERGGGAYSAITVKNDEHPLATFPNQLPETITYGGTSAEHGTRVTTTDDCDVVFDWDSAPNRSSINCYKETTVFTSFMLTLISDENVRSDLIENIAMYLGYIVPDELAVTSTNTLTSAPKQTKLHANMPNPFNPVTTISYDIAAGQKVELSIHNIKGQLVKTLINDYEDAGQHSVVWYGKDNSGSSVASGVYFYTLRTNNKVESNKMLLLK